MRRTASVERDLDATVLLPDLAPPPGLDTTTLGPRATLDLGDHNTPALGTRDALEQALVLEPPGLDATTLPLDAAVLEPGSPPRGLASAARVPNFAPGGVDVTTLGATPFDPQGSDFPETAVPAPGALDRTRSDLSLSVLSPFASEILLEDAPPAYESVGSYGCSYADRLAAHVPLPAPKLPVVLDAGYFRPPAAPEPSWAALPGARALQCRIGCKVRLYFAGLRKHLFCQLKRFNPRLADGTACG